MCEKGDMLTIEVMCQKLNALSTRDLKANIRSERKKRRHCLHSRSSQVIRSFGSPSNSREPVKTVVSMAMEPWSACKRRKMKSHLERKIVSNENVFKFNTGTMIVTKMCHTDTWKLFKRFFFIKLNNAKIQNAICYS